MRIAHVLGSLSLRMGGPSVTAVGLVGALSTRGVAADIFTTDLLTPAETRGRIGGAGLDEMPPGAEMLSVSVSPVRTPLRIAYSPELGDALRAQISDYDLVHIHGLNLYPQYVAWQSARKYKRPYIVSPKGALDPWIRSQGKLRKAINDAVWQRRMLDGAAALHLTTSDERDLVVPMGIKAPHVVVPNGLDVGSFQQETLAGTFRSRWLNGFDGALILNHGRISAKKGLDILIDALPQVAREMPVRLALVGVDDEGLGAVLLRQAEHLGIRNCITFVPGLVGDELRSAIVDADVWVLPSHTENFGVAVVEAMAAGKAIVTSPHVNIAPDAAKSGALIVVQNSPKDVAKAIITLLESPGHRQQLGETASKYAWRYDWSRVVDQYIEMYECVSSRRHHFR